MFRFPFLCRSRVYYVGGSKLGEGEREHALISSLQSLCKEHDRETARQAIETLLTLANNIIKSPIDEKYRRVKTQNKSFSSKVWCLPEAQQFLHHWGWIEVEECVVLPSDEDIQLVKQILLKKFNAIPSRSSGAASKSEPLTEKEKQLQEERRKLLERKKLEDQEKARIKAQIEADRKNLKDREIRESKAKKLGKFGGKMTKFEDIGVDLNKGGG
ncbi:peptide-N(4)-(N-acetyl-beta-glucosaminyl)asparagine amidase-like isoform X1 [Orbicella faveolata]|uniref:peptide-N(4)-(N-acetyl-beta- glucosaminyl)asparagine amidase-like isoform X1 n=1 Tax=Orbicella faveolata TaxID=48498 RepID=UPI0009E39FA5|nr:peptide-N(4)-(N-acetyl-beta-glucosaminyl)asparagine amidase-like isoform X1 [Orbicella faveolata]